MPKFVARFKTKTQVEVWYRKWDALEYEEDEKIYKRVDPHRSTPTRMIIRKFINSLPSKYVELLTIMGPTTLAEAIEAVMDVEASQKVKARKRDQAYMVDTIEELRHEIHNLQVNQAKPKQAKLVT